MLLLLVMGLKRQTSFAPWLTFLLLSAEVVAINVLIAFNGAASNPYNAVLLLPLVLAFMLLPLRHSGSLLLFSIGAQLGQILLLPSQGHHQGMMLAHSYAMVGSFILTSLLVAAVVCYFHYQIAHRERTLQTFRERQLRDEQLLAIGTAAAQLTHDVATPTQSIRLLLEEASQREQNSDWFVALAQQFSRIEQQLHSWREVANDVREQRLHCYEVMSLVSSLRYLMQIARPETDIDWQNKVTTQPLWVSADRTLLPAITSIIINACEAAQFSDMKQVVIIIEHRQSHWFLQVNNHVKALSNRTLEALGSQILPSHHGHGIGAVLSNATLEKFAGKVNWQVNNGVMTTTISLPLSEHNA